MSIPEIIDLVFRIGSLVVTVILAILAIKRKVVTVKGDSNSTLFEKFSSICGTVKNAVLEVEETYSNLFKEGAKAGSFKLRDVLAIAKDACENESVDYDKSYWTGYINMLVNVMNSQKSVHLNGPESVVGPIGESDPELAQMQGNDFKYIGGNK